MRTTKAFFVLVVSMLSMLSFAQSEDPALRRSIEAFYQKVDRMANRGDWEGVLASMAPDAVMADQQGNRMDKNQIRQMFMGMKSSMRNMRMKSNVRHARAMGENEASAWVEMVMHWQQKQGRRWVTMKQTMRVAESLRRNGNSWSSYYMQELPTNAPWPFKTGS